MHKIFLEYIQKVKNYSEIIFYLMLNELNILADKED